jgi:hypothetical protein
MNRFAVLRAGYGTLLLVAPGPVIRVYTGHRADRLTRAVTRVLGSRHLVQGLCTAGTPSALVLALGVEVDLAHVASMLGLAVLDRRRRRAGLVDAVAAGSFAIAGTVLATRAALSRRPAAVTPNPGDAARSRLVARLEAWRQSAATWTASQTLPRPIRNRLTR